MSVDSIRVVHPLFFQAEDGGSIPTSALQLHIATTNITIAKMLNALWHSRLPRYESMATLCFSATYDGLYYATAIWANPVARALPQHTWLELRRLAVADDAPPNTCTRIIGQMTRHIRKQMPWITTLLSYQDTEVHHGTIYKASGWTIGRMTTGDTWARPNRYRPETQTSAPKIRWEKTLRRP